MSDKIKTVRMLLGIKDSEEDDLLSFIISDVENLINGYCRTEDIPTKLSSLVPVMAADLYRRRGYGRKEAPQRVETVTEGQRSVSFFGNKQNSETEDFLLEYEARLKPFKCRRGKVPSDV